MRTELFLKETKDFRIFVGLNDQDLYVTEIDVHSKYSVLSYKTIGTREDLLEFRHKTETIFINALKDLGDVKFRYGNKLLNGGTSRYREDERKAYDTIRHIIDQIELLKDAILEKIDGINRVSSR